MDPISNAERQPTPQQTSNTTPARSSKPDSLCESTLPNRRRFLTSLLQDSVTMACTLHVIKSVGKDALIMHQHKPEKELPHSYPFTNEWVELAPGMGFQNLGVAHDAQQFLKDRETLMAAIKKHDVVLLEGSSDEPYFDFIAGLAHHYGKKVVRLESNRPLLREWAVLGSSFTAAPLIIAFNVCHYWNRLVGSRHHNTDGTGQALSNAAVENQGTEPAKASQIEAGNAHAGATNAASTIAEGQGLKPSWRRTFLSLLGTAAYELLSVRPGVRKSKENPSSLIHNDWSYAVDGRTVLMLGQIENFLRDNNNPSAVCISGTSHAIGFSEYLSSPEARQLFREKLALYDRVYKPVFGSKAEVEVDPR